MIIQTNNQHCATWGLELNNKIKIKMRHTEDRVVLIQHNITTMTNKIINIYKAFKYVQFTYRVPLQPHKYSIPNIIRVCN